MIFISCVSKLLYIVNISSYKKEQLKLLRSFLGVRGGGNNSLLNSPLSPTFSCNGKKIKLWRRGSENNTMRSSISDQYNENASTRACFLKFLGE